MKIKFFVSIFCLLYLACADKKEEIKLSHTVQELVDSLSISDESTPGLVFISHDYPKARNYNAYHEFIKTATEKELKYLTDYKKPNIRCYAFNGLVERNNPGVRKIFEAHLKDTAQVSVSFGGCIIIQTTVMEFMLDQLHPSGSKSSERFSKKEFGEYLKLKKVKASH